ncbi:hypothetical protein KEJ39_07005 [Candidatus Bathyarchaeota archaeon]|nr:hypothetical protein [Candidatus Bathyarchaeota archaeon]
MTKKAGVGPALMATGEVAKNTGPVAALAKELGVEVNPPEKTDPQLIGALGAATITKGRLEKVRIRFWFSSYHSLPLMGLLAFATRAMLTKAATQSVATTGKSTRFVTAMPQREEWKMHQTAAFLTELLHNRLSLSVTTSLEDIAYLIIKMR